MVNVAANPKGKEKIIQFDKKTAEKLKLKSGDEVLFCFGQQKSSLIVEIRNTKSNINIFLTNKDIKYFKLIVPKKYGINVKGNQIKLGPVVGVMADLFKQKAKPFGPQSFFIKQMITNGDNIGVFCFAFCPYNINLDKKIIRGYTYKNNKWFKSTFPLPDVIFPRERGYSHTNLKVRSKLEQLGCYFLNPPLIGKWETYQILSKNPMLLKYLPETELINNFNQINKMVKKHGAVYIKPVKGSQGRNIIRLRKKRNSSYEYKYEINNHTTTGSAIDIHHLRRQLSSIMGNKRFIVQKEIDLLRNRDHIIDLRIFVQKDHTGKWSITGKACRVGRLGSITSNISSGGKGYKVESMLMRHFPDKELREKILHDINYVSIESVKSLERAIGKIGEMGVDIGVDKKGKVWFIEANMRPARHVFNLIGETDTRLQSVIKPLLYSRYLAGFR